MLTFFHCQQPHTKQFRKHLSTRSSPYKTNTWEDRLICTSFKRSTFKLPRKSSNCIKHYQTINFCSWLTTTLQTNITLSKCYGELLFSSIAAMLNTSEKLKSSGSPREGVFRSFQCRTTAKVKSSTNLCSRSSEWSESKYSRPLIFHLRSVIIWRVLRLLGDVRRGKSYLVRTIHSMSIFSVFAMKLSNNAHLLVNTDVH